MYDKHLNHGKLSDYWGVTFVSGIRWLSITGKRNLPCIFNNLPSKNQNYLFFRKNIILLRINRA